jgi:hypothetical protein
MILQPPLSHTIQTDYPTRIVILLALSGAEGPAPFPTGSDHSDAKDPSSNSQYLRDLEIRYKQSLLGRFLLFPTSRI